MQEKIGKLLAQAIRSEKWFFVTYGSKEDESISKFWVSIHDILFDRQEPRLLCYIYNPNKDIDEAKDVHGGLYLNKIQSASIIDFTHYDVPDALLKKLDENIGKWEWLDYDLPISYLLNYYDECNRLDKDPYQKEYVMIPGIDLSMLMNNRRFKLTSEQKEHLLKIYGKYFHKSEFADKPSITEFAISKLAINNAKRNRCYIVCYYNVYFDPKQGVLCLDKTLRFNKSFLHKRMLENRAIVDDGKSTLFQYTEMDVDEFVSNFSKDEQWGLNVIMENLKNDELLNTCPEMMILEREIVTDVRTTYDAILAREQDGTMNVPLKSFFGRTTSRDKRRKEPNIIICDEKINVDQTRVLYNAMKQPVTYVQGPPGTGKTQTILNVVLNGFYNGKTMMICSSNNKPVDGIIEKLTIYYKDKPIPFPFLRLGNLSQVKKALVRIRELFEYTSNREPDDEKINRIKNSTDNKNAQLNEILARQEKHVQIESYLTDARELLHNVEGASRQLTKNLEKHISELEEQAILNPEVQNDEVLRLFTPLKNDFSLIQWMYFTSLKYIRALQKPRFEDLRKICYKENEDDCVTEFNKWLSVDANMKKFSEVFPIIFTTNISAQRLGTPNYVFDLVIMDEAGQCNVAQALIPITKANALLLVGDPLQLKPIVVLEDFTNRLLKDKYSITGDYDYKHNSILDIMRNHDSISQYVLLKYHYRCGKKIIGFSNKKYYNSRLDLSAIKDMGDLVWMPMRNKTVEERNSACDEAKAVVDYVVRNNYKDAVIITPFVNQKELINRMLNDVGIYGDVVCDTVHAMQGGEKDTVILSTALSPQTSRRTFEWIKNNTELINVAITRAKKKLVVACDDEILNMLSKGENSDIYDLVKYVKSNGTSEVPLNEALKIEFGKSNNSYYEKEFYKTISQFCSVNETFEAKRNVPFSTIFADDAELSKSGCEFDCVLYEKSQGKIIPKVVIEINGGEHFGDKKREENDKKKESICRSKDMRFIMIPNTFVKSYEQLRGLIINSKDILDTQTSLFDIWDSEAQ